ncbi:hypothetical protein BB561_003810 [Smittium simulii]|uniref:NADPH:adrenodoxin oxidoreductase, mitochondrial n=1 Tax=Smittium simulii TaxID=133385 RepID=A0A2T9YJD7_9FUNG|nr:hypothetical protein BB561_003810 [Smittium simulii]
MSFLKLLQRLPRCHFFISDLATSHATLRAFSSSSVHRLNVAIIGAGPAGFYTASKILDKDPDARIDIFEKLPCPYGLVRFGVAPDHPEVKICTNKFDELGQDPRVRFFGNVNVGEHGKISVTTLSKLYGAVAISYGTSSCRNLNIPGEFGSQNEQTSVQVGGIHSGREFVHFYNSYPQHRTIFSQNFLSSGVTGRALVFDINPAALDMLSASKISHVDIIGRRGPLEAAFTTKELRELLSLPNLVFKFDYKQFNDCLDNERAVSTLSKSRPLQRKIDLIKKFESNQQSKSPSEHTISALTNSTFKPKKSWSLRFLESPIAVINHKESIDVTMEPSKSVIMAKNRLIYSSDSKISIENTGEQFTLDCDVAFKSIGYISTPIQGVPFDYQKMIIPNISGRVVDSATNDIINGLYVSGWIKTGATGVLANTMQSAFETANAIIADKPDISKNVPLSAINDTLHKHNILQTSVSYEQWLTLKELERANGEILKKPSLKIDSVSEMLKVVKR